MTVEQNLMHNPIHTPTNWTTCKIHVQPLHWMTPAVELTSSDLYQSKLKACKSKRIPLPSCCTVRWNWSPFEQCTTTHQPCPSKHHTIRTQPNLPSHSPTPNKIKPTSLLVFQSGTYWFYIYPVLHCNVCPAVLNNPGNQWARVWNQPLRRCIKAENTCPC